MSEENKKNMTGEELILSEIRNIKKSIDTEREAVNKTVADSQKSAEEKEKAVTKFNEETGKRLGYIEDQLKKLSITLPGAESVKNKFDISKAIYGISRSNFQRYHLSEEKAWQGCELEKEILDQTMKTMSSIIGADGGFLVPQEVMGEIVEPLRAMSVIDKLGSRIIPFTGSPVTLRKQTSSAVSYFLGESGTITPSTPGFGALKMEPKKLATFVIIPNELLSQVGAVKQLVIKDMVKSMALKRDWAFLEGTGGAHTPQGIVKYAGVSTVECGDGTDGGYLTFAKLKEMFAKIEDENVELSNVGVVMRSNVKNNLALERIKNYDLQVVGGSYVVPGMPIINDVLLQNLVGYKIGISNQLSKTLTKGANSDCSYVIAGNWDEFLVGEWGGMQIAESTEFKFQTDETCIRVINRIDSLLRHEEGFCVSSDAINTLKS